MIKKEIFEIDDDFMSQLSEQIANTGSIPRTMPVSHNPDYKFCTKCAERKPIEDFQKDYSRAGRFLSRCKECFYAARKQTKEQNSIRHANYGRKWTYKNKFNLTFEAVEAIINLQDNKCAICETPISLDVKGQVCVDHSHVTNRVRGILCRNCNTGIGQFKDRIALVQSALLYLMKNGE